jgi:hypothetical protein
MWYLPIEFVLLLELTLKLVSDNLKVVILSLQLVSGDLKVITLGYLGLKVMRGAVDSL